MRLFSQDIQFDAGLSISTYSEKVFMQTPCVLSALATGQLAALEENE